MKYTEAVMNYNKQIKEALSLIYNELNNGQKKKIIKNERVKTLLVKYGVMEK